MSYFKIYGMRSNIGISVFMSDCCLTSCYHDFSHIMFRNRLYFDEMMIIMNIKFKQWWPSIPPLSIKQQKVKQWWSTIPPISIKQNKRKSTQWWSSISHINKAKSLKSDGHQFHQYQQNEQSHLISTELTEHKQTTTYDVGNPSPICDFLLNSDQEA